MNITASKKSSEFIVEETCLFCSKIVTFEVSKKAAEELIMRSNGESSKPIQNIIPEISADKRELLISQICGECFDKMFSF